MFDGIDPTTQINPPAMPWRLHGALDGDSAPRLRERFAALAGAAHGDVVLDFSAVGFIDGSGIGALGFLSRRLAASRRRLVVVGATGQPLATLHDLGLAKVLGIAGRRPPDRAAVDGPAALGVRA